MFSKNMGSTDRLIRTIVGIVLIAAYFMGWLSGTLALIGLIVGIVMLATAALGSCPPYGLLGINTCGTKSK
ncbi:MAG: YgaP family membrane protein [Brevirhabdus sp.]